jgi:RNA polymerase sigma factor FliA
VSSTDHTADLDALAADADTHGDEDLLVVDAPVTEEGVSSKQRQPRTPTDPRILSLWEDYERFKSDPAAQEAVRDELMIHYSPLVKYVAGKVASNLPSNIDQNDLVSAGVFGLMDAMEKFELSRGLKFETYAITRIRGAIIDHLRKTDWVPRSVRNKMRAVEQAVVRLETRNNRTPSDEEIAAEMEISLQELRAMYSQFSATTLIALDEISTRGSANSNGDEGAVALSERLTDDRTELPGEAFEDAETREALALALTHLDERSRIVIALYYYEDLTLAEIGQVLGVTESRVCQLHARATSLLRAQLSNDH